MELPPSLRTPLYQAPRLIIERQPKKRGYRFRYKSEGETHGGIPGESDVGSSSKKFYPTIKIVGYTGPAKIVVTLVTANKPYHLHAHSMIVNREPKKGYCIFDMNGSSNTLELKNIAIQHAVKERLMDTLMDRILQNRYIQHFGWNSAFKPGEIPAILDVDHYTSILEDKDDTKSFYDRTTAKAVAGAELKELQKQAKQLSKTMAMNSCRLCFQAFLIDPQSGKYTTVLDSVVSDEIIDGKTKEGATLKIVRLSAVVSSVGGGDEVWLLADKLNADDVEVRFFKKDGAGNLEWEAFGEFTKADVFKQAVLIFRTPAFQDLTIRQPTKVFLQLRRKKDRSCTSDPTVFTYKPKKFDQYGIHAKRKKSIPKELLEGNFKKSTVDLSSINFGQSTNIGPVNNQTGPLHALSESQHWQATNQPMRFMMGNNNVSPQQNAAHSMITALPAPTSAILTSAATSLTLPLASQSMAGQLGSLENLEISDSFMNNILSSDVKEEPVTHGACEHNPVNEVLLNPNNDPNSQTSLYNELLQNFSSDILNFNPNNPNWDQLAFGVKKMEE